MMEEERQQENRDDSGTRVPEQVVEEEDQGEEEDPGDTTAFLLYPRSKFFFYDKVLAGQRLWRRPPHNYCKRCDRYEKCKMRMDELHHALLCTPGDVKYVEAQQVIAAGKGRMKCTEELRQLQHKLPDLQKHVEWMQTARVYLNELQNTLPADTAMWQLDYGGFSDSSGDKVSVWSATVMVQGEKQRNFDFFFDQVQSSNQPTTAERAKKNAHTGKFFLAEMLSPQRNTVEAGVSMFKQYYPGVRAIILSGDTGNGFRSNVMLEQLSTVFTEFNYHVQLIPLAPGHAWNRTDARLAHMNTFVKCYLRKARLHGAKEFALTFQAASSDRLRHRRKHMERSHVQFREVPLMTTDAALQKQFGARVVSDVFERTGKMGLRGFLFFDFSVKGKTGVLEYPRGFARVREHANPNRPSNPTFVFTWRKDLLRTICQPCSDAFGGPVLLSENNCSKKKCAVAKFQVMNVLIIITIIYMVMAFITFITVVVQNRDHQHHDHNHHHQVSSSQPSSSSAGSGVADVDVDAAPALARRKQRKSRQAASTKLVQRDVRVVHGEGKDNRREYWLYVPYDPSAKSGSKRSGWWLHPEPGRPGYYYIGPKAPVQTSTLQNIPDVARFPDFPFVEKVNTDGKGSRSVRCVTHRLLSPEELSIIKEKDSSVVPPSEVDSESEGDDDEYDDEDNIDVDHDDDDDDDNVDEDEDEENVGSPEGEEEDSEDVPLAPQWTGKKRRATTTTSSLRRSQRRR